MRKGFADCVIGSNCSFADHQADIDGDGLLSVDTSPAFDLSVVR